jgi:hypothetical protein
VAEDKIGNRSGAYANSPVAAAGKVRGALRFNGTNYVAAQDSDVWAFGARDFTVELWANFASPGGGSVGHPSHILLGNDEGPFSRNKWFFALGGGYLLFIQWPCGRRPILSPRAVLADGRRVVSLSTRQAGQHLYDLHQRYCYRICN